MSPVEKEKPKRAHRSAKQVYYEAVGRRKSATCRVRLYVNPNGTVNARGITAAKGTVTVNGKDITAYFPGKYMQLAYERPYVITDTKGRFTVFAVISGGGPVGQMEAFVLASARALQKADTSLRPALKKEGFLMVDARVRERRKAGLAQKARKEKQSPKR